VNWTPDIDASTIPDEVIRSEWGRRNNAKRKTHGAGRGKAGKSGRPRKTAQTETETALYGDKPRKVETISEIHAAIDRENHRRIAVADALSMFPPMSPRKCERCGGPVRPDDAFKVCNGDVIAICSKC